MSRQFRHRATGVTLAALFAAGSAAGDRLGVRRAGRGRRRRPGVRRRRRTRAVLRRGAEVRGSERAGGFHGPGGQRHRPRRGAAARRRVEGCDRRTTSSSRGAVPPRAGGGHAQAELRDRRRVHSGAGHGHAGRRRRTRRRPSRCRPSTPPRHRRRSPRPRWAPPRRRRRRRGRGRRAAPPRSRSGRPPSARRRGPRRGPRDRSTRTRTRTTGTTRTATRSQDDVGEPDRSAARRRDPVPEPSRRAGAGRSGHDAVRPGGRGCRAGRGARAAVRAEPGGAAGVGRDDLRLRRRGRRNPGYSRATCISDYNRVNSAAQGSAGRPTSNLIGVVVPPQVPPNECGPGAPRLSVRQGPATSAGPCRRTGVSSSRPCARPWPAGRDQLGAGMLARSAVSSPWESPRGVAVWTT